MGLYSFYKIIKDVVKTILGNKAWRYTLIVALIVIVFTIYSTKVNAEELHDYIVDYYTTFSDTQGDPGYRTTTKYLFIPVFANSSYAISWTSGISVNFYFLDSTNYRVNGSNVANFPNNYIETQTQGSYGYFAIKDGYLIVSYRAYDGYYDTGNPVNPNFNITTDYDFTSNLATIHQDLVNLMNTLQGTNLESSTTPSTISGLSVSNGGGNGSFQSGSSSIIYFELDQDKVNNFDFTIVSRFSGFSHVYGYCNAIPSSGVAYNFLGSCVNASEYNNVTASVPKGAKYFFVRLNGSNSTFTLNSYSVGYGGLDEVNNQVINQGNQTRDTITDSNISQDNADYSLPTDNTNDITLDGFGSIFDRIRATFTSGSATPITITIPFTNRSFTISKQSVFGSANLGIVGTLIQSFWWFVVSLFIVKDIFKKIEAIKSGNIEFAETTNIKEDIL